MIATPWQKGAGFPPTTRGRYRQVSTAARTIGSSRADADERSIASATEPSAPTQTWSLTECAVSYLESLRTAMEEADRSDAASTPPPPTAASTLPPPTSLDG